MEEYLNKVYVLTSSENLDDYLKHIGKGYFERKAAIFLRPEHTLLLQYDGSYVFRMTSSLVCFDVTFVPGEEFEEIIPPGTKMKSKIIFEGNKMIHIQKFSDGKESKHVREFFEDKMIVTTTADGLDKIVIRRYTIKL